MSKSFLEKQKHIKQYFTDCHTAEEIYKKIIELGKKMPKISKEYKKQENLVAGCQSLMYIYAEYKEDETMMFQAESEAIISNGLAALLLMAYNGEKPEIILQYPPKFIEELNISSSLSPGRSNGLSSLYLKMKQEALKILLYKSKQSK